MNVAELIALLQQHGISPPVKTEVASTARTSAADSATNTLAVEPEEVTLDTGTGFIRCPNCNTGLTMFAAVATDVDGVTTRVSSAPAANTATRATSASASVPTASTSMSTAASTVHPGPITSTSRSARWYAVTRGREIGVFYGRWDGNIQNLVNNVPCGNAVRFSTEEDARHYFHLQELAGNTRVVPMP